jgi:hypothetical protein
MASIFDSGRVAEKHRGEIPCSAILVESFQERSMAEQPKQPVQIKADEKELLGQYSNLAVIHHTNEEFTLNFIYLFPNVPQGKLVSSLIVSPMHAKRLMRAMEENVTRYEAQYGTIPEGPAQEPNVGFVQ